MSENVQNIQQTHKLHYKSHRNLKRVINCKRTNPSGGENPKRHPSGKLPLATVICYNIDAT